jgi:hypothetical protein
MSIPITFNYFTAVPIKNAVFWNATLLTLIKTDVSEERVSNIGMVRISEL